MECVARGIGGHQLSSNIFGNNFADLMVNSKRNERLNHRHRIALTRKFAILELIDHRRRGDQLFRVVRHIKPLASPLTTRNVGCITTHFVVKTRDTRFNINTTHNFRLSERATRFLLHKIIERRFAKNSRDLTDRRRKPQPTKQSKPAEPRRSRARQARPEPSARGNRPKGSCTNCRLSLRRIPRGTRIVHAKLVRARRPTRRTTKTTAKWPRPRIVTAKLMINTRETCTRRAPAPIRLHIRRRRNHQRHRLTIFRMGIIGVPVGHLGATQGPQVRGLGVGFRRAKQDTPHRNAKS